MRLEAAVAGPGYSGSPIGDPSPADGGGTGPWMDRLHAQLAEQRIVLLRGELDDDLAGRVTAELIMLDASGDAPVTLHVDSGGGPIHAAFSVIDTIDLLGVPVETVCVGRAEGSAVGVVAAAPSRQAARHARFRLSEPSSSVAGRAVELAAWAEHHQAQLARFVERLAAATGRAGEHVEADLSVGRWLDAPAAVSYGLVDRLWEPGTRDRRSLGFGPT
ncbi:MAG: ATP-dependent Clp protease proteolytic subunit [Actinomycetota bacterium]|nr:ATP-dependent Clp protease proteolytic subunit [Actinomycetota bacterium]